MRDSSCFKYVSLSNELFIYSMRMRVKAFEGMDADKKVNFKTVFSKMIIDNIIGLERAHMRGFKSETC